MLKKKYVKSRRVCKVTFEVPVRQLPADVEIHSFGVAGEFNDWDPDKLPLRFSKSKKAYHAKTDLQPGRAYQFRYVLNQEVWLNDWHADAYVPNNVNGDNSVVFGCDGD